MRVTPSEREERKKLRVGEALLEPVCQCSNLDWESQTLYTVTEMLYKSLERVRRTLHYARAPPCSL